MQSGKIANIAFSWRSLCKSLSIGSNLETKWWETIKTHYSEPWRYYHTLNHIDELINYFQQYSPKIKDTKAVQLSIWFHDVIYDPKKNDNEEKSADLFVEFAEETKLDLSTKVKDYILATKSHKITEGDSDLEYFMDFDLAILGKEKSAYEEYSKNIRREYIHYPEEAYRKGRTQVLQKLIDGKLYVTHDFVEIFDKSAKENMKEEILLLASPSYSLL